MRSSMWGLLRRVVSLGALVGPALVITAELSAQTASQTPDATQALRSVTVADLVGLRDIGSYSRGKFSVSPDGRALAYQLQQADVRSSGYRLTWHVVPIEPDAEPILLGDGGDIRLMSAPDGRTTGLRAAVEPRWSPDGEWIAYTLKQDGKVQVWRSARSGGGQERLTNNAADVRSLDWSSDGSRIFFRVGRDRDVMKRTDRREGDRGFLFDERFWPYHSTDPQWFDCQEHPWGLSQPTSQTCHPTLWVYEVSTGVERLARSEERREYQELKSVNRPAFLTDERVVQSIHWGETNSRVAWLENEKPNTNAGHYPPLTVFAAAPDQKRCSDQACRGLIEILGWAPDEDVVYFLRREGVAFSRRALYAWAVGESPVRKVLATDDLLTGCRLVDDRAVCLHESPTTPRKIISIQLKDGIIDVLVDPNPEFRNIRFSDFEKLKWQDDFGNDVFGHLVYPLGYQPGSRYPLIVVQYRSSGFLRGGTGDEYPIHALAANGFAVLSFDRPNDWSLLSRTKDFSQFEAIEWDGFYERRRALTALNAVLDELDERGIVDPDRIGITGLSDGAETVSYALIHSDRFAVAAASNSYWSPAIYHMVGLWFREHFRNVLGEPRGAGLDNWREISLGLNADRVNTPLLIQVSDHELLPSTHNFYALREAQKPVEMHVFPNEYHIKWQPQHRLNIYRRNVQWMKFWLQDVEDPDPVDPEQYTRWRTLREQHRANQRALEQAQRPLDPGQAQSAATAELGGE